MKKNLFYLLTSVLLVIFSFGCDQARNPLSAIIGGGYGDNNEAVSITPGQATDITISLGKDGQGLSGKVLFPGDLKESKGTNLAPSSTGNIQIESNVFADMQYPETKTVNFNAVNDFANTKVKAHTVVVCYLKASIKDGGELFDIWINGVKLINYTGGAFQFVVETDGKITQLKPATNLKDISFSLQTNESSGTTIYLSSDVTGWASVPMVYKNGSWTYTGCYIPNKVFRFVMWSDKRAIYKNEITINGTSAVYMVKIQAATNTAYAVYHFEGKVDDSSKYINGGADNRTILIN